MANPKIQLTYLWTDEAVMRDDFQLKVSRDMAEWATTFYRRFDLDIDVQPTADVRSAVNRASKYALRKSDGIRPSPFKMGASDRDVALLGKLRDKFISKAKAASDAIVKSIASEGALDAHRAAAKILFGQSTATMALPQLQAHVAALNASNAETDRLTAIHKADREVALRLKAESEKAEKELRAQEKKVRDTSTVVRSDAEMREQMSERFKKDGIGDGHRLNVVFSRFELDPTGKSTTRSMTYLSMPDPVFDPATRFFLWPYTYVIVDLAATVSSVAHEIVRAAGHVPPDAQRVFKEMEKRIRGLKQPLGVIGRQPAKSILEEEAWEYDYIPRYEEIPGGFLDGPKNDIMNAGRDDILPNEIILSDPDKRRLLAAPFVST